MEVNLLTLTYLFLRLAPFIMVCFFVFASFFNQDFKGLVYLFGLIITCAIIKLFVAMPFISTLLGTSMFKVAERGQQCNAFEMNIYGFKTSNDLPMGQIVLGYTYAYLLTIIATNKIYWSNLPTIIFFPFVMIFDMAWSMTNQCNTFMMLIFAIALGSLGGWGWAKLLQKTKNTNLLYFSFVGGNDVSCSRPAKQSFKCSMKLISKENSDKKGKG